MNGVSIIVCTFNGKLKLERTLGHILQVKFNHPWELIIVDNASTDNTKEYCSELLLKCETSFGWKIVNEHRPGLSYARVRGLRESMYDILLFCDDDNGLSFEYLQIGFEIFEKNPNIGALGGCGFPIFEGDIPPWFDYHSHSFAVGPQSKSNGRIRGKSASLYGAGSFFKKSVLLKFFDRGYQTIMRGRTANSLVSGEDVEWCYIVQLLGYEIWYDSRLTFTHLMPESRMQWSYYLRLKQGIASGAGLLFPYSCLLRNRSINSAAYGWHWLYKSFVSALIYFKQKVGSAFIIRSIDPERELALVILHAKMKSYFFNGLRAFFHFLKLRSIQ